MYSHSEWSTDDAHRQAADRRTASLAAFAVVLLLLVGGLFLIQRLRVASLAGDCLMSGRSNCDAVLADTP